MIDYKNIDWKRFRGDLAGKAVTLKDLGERHQNALFFTGGFLFDLVTLDRIDSWLDLAVQGLYLVCITLLLILRALWKKGRWTPPAKLS